jgi:hypothetical protein
LTEIDEASRRHATMPRVTEASIECLAIALFLAATITGCSSASPLAIVMLDLQCRFSHVSGGALCNRINTMLGHGI